MTKGLEGGDFGVCVIGFGSFELLGLVLVILYIWVWFFWGDRRWVSRRFGPGIGIGNCCVFM